MRAFVLVATIASLAQAQADTALPPRMTGLDFTRKVESPFTARSGMPIATVPGTPGAALVGAPAGPRDSSTVPAAARPIWAKLPIDFQGTTTTMGELYRHAGETQARRPAGVWRVSASPQLTLFGELRMGIDALLSSEGSQFRQNVDQVGFNPTWRWITAHAGDFSRDYSSYTVSGTRIRGAGIDLKPGRLQMSFQGGRAQRTVASGSDGAAYRRDLFAATVGYGTESGNRIALTVMKAKDDPTSLEQQLVVVDSTVSDTSLTADPLKFATTPQENLVLGVETGLSLLNGIVKFKGQAGASLFTRDLRSQVIGDEGVGALGGVASLQPLRLSTSGDAAFEGQVDVKLGDVGLRGGYEHVGAGYTSLGLPNLISDREGFNLGASVTLLQNRLSLTGDTKQQSNNLVDQKSARTDRSNNNLSAMFAFSQRLSNSINLVTSRSKTAASDVAPGIDLATLSITTSLTSQVTAFEKATAVSFSYSYQTSEDHEAGSIVPSTVGHNVSATVTSALTPKVSFGPTISAVSNKSGDQEAQNNVLLGFQMRAKMLDKDRLTLSGNFTNTYSSGRKIQAARAELGYPLPFDAKLSVQFRHSNYSAFANKKAFNESFLTTSVTRSLSVGKR